MLMAASSSTPPLSVSYTPGRPNLLHKHPQLILSCLSIPELCEVFSDFMSEDCRTKELPVGQRPFLPPLQQCGDRCVSALFAHVRHTAHCGATALKRPHFFPCFTGTVNVPWSSHAPFALIFLHSLPLPPLTEVSSLYCMVQKQNHKPISVTLAMRLDGPNLSPSGAIGSTPVSLKRPLSSRQRGSFLFGDNCSWALAVHVTHSVAFWDMMACCAHCRQAMSSCMATFARKQSNCTFSAFKQSFQKIPNSILQLKKEKGKHMKEHVWSSCFKHNIEANLWC